MKTALEIPDDLYREAKVLAAEKRLKMKDLVSEGLRFAIDHHRRGHSNQAMLDLLAKTDREPWRTAEEADKFEAEVQQLRQEDWMRRLS